MKPSIRIMFVVAAAFVVAGVVFRQEKEMRRLRAVIALLTSVPKEEAAIAAVTNPLPVDIEELRREAAEVHRLRAEITQLRREKVEAGALQARMEKPALDVSALFRKLSSDSVAGFGEYGHRATNTSPEEAARWVATLPAGKEQERAALAVIELWTRSDSAAAGAWATQFAEGPLREEAMSVVARHWGQRDWNATAGWLETLPMGASRDAAIGAFVTSADGYDIRLALEWANQMEAPESRATRVEGTARRWLREDNATARAWLEKAQLPSGVAERLLSAE